MDRGSGSIAESVLDRFHPAVREWFLRTLGEPTAAQKLGWPQIAAGRNTLIAAPTGSGKTLAAFLAALDLVWKNPEPLPGVRILYLSPLKALNQDVARNLEFPLKGILDCASELDLPLRPIRLAVRSGDSTPAERARVVKKPPEILITTPESLHLLLTSRARAILRGISHVILDEIHAICSDKRGVFTSLLLERLQALVGRPFVRVGLSATQRPLEEVARFLGGFERRADGSWSQRPVEIVDAGRKRALDLRVIWTGLEPVTSSTESVWPAIERRLLELASDHRSTIIFANNRRLVERLSTRLGEAALAIDSGADGEEDAPSFRAHHGSISLEERRATENALKSGELKAVVATASLELGIDMGAVDLVCQVESPGQFSRGHQRVGRAGHAVGGVGKGRLIAKTPADLLEMAALCRGMLAGEVEHLQVPRGCLDLLAQQVLACVATEPWDVAALYDLVRSAYSYVDLPAEVFESVLAMISGRFARPGFRDLRPRASWDRVHNRLYPLPGTAQAALLGGGTIPDTGQFPVYLGENGPRLGELDEEFVHERRVGEIFSLGTATWRIESIDPHRVIVSRAHSPSALTPFWRGEGAGRSAELGSATGALAREIETRLDDPDLIPWLERECLLEPEAAARLRSYIAAQNRASFVPSDRVVLVESFVDQVGELGLAVVTPFGRRLHQALAIALAAVLRERLGIEPACLHTGEGILFRLPRLEEAPLDLLDHLDPARGSALVENGLVDTPLFGLKFRQNAARALLMPRPDPGKRTPLWLQRLRAKDLLQAVRAHPDHPIMVETARQCLDDELEIQRLQSFLEAIQMGAITIAKSRRETASPMVSEMLLKFQATFIYEWDEPRRSGGDSSVDPDLLAPLLASGDWRDWLDREIVNEHDERLRGGKFPPRTADEAFERLRGLGDLFPHEISADESGFFSFLGQEGRVRQIALAGDSGPPRWVLAEEAQVYHAAFGPAARGDETCSWSGREERRVIVERFLRTRALTALAEVVARYPIAVAEATLIIEDFVARGDLVRIGDAGDERARFADRATLIAMRRSTLAARRRERAAVAPEVFADFVARRQHLHPRTRLVGEPGVAEIMDLLSGIPATVSVWEGEFLARRIENPPPRPLDRLLASGTWDWRVGGEGEGDPRVAFWPRRSALGGPVPAGPADDWPPDARTLFETMKDKGALDPIDLARITGLPPSRVRSGLLDLVRAGVATSDTLDPVREGSDALIQDLRQAAFGGRTRSRRRLEPRPEGRYWIPPDNPDHDRRVEAWAWALLDRYGVAARELSLLELLAPPWAEIMAYLDKAEWRGEVERGYFVEGLSGLQFATADAARTLEDRLLRPQTDDDLVLLSSRDPANLYGSGAPFDVNLSEGGQTRLVRTAGTGLILASGRPLLIVESHGKKVSTLPWADPLLIERALDFLPSFIGPGRRFLRVESYNGEAAATSGAAELLARIGFVRDYPAMTYYPTWGRANPAAVSASPGRP